ncbi:MAG: DegT/DnrJ/EryC1/StrS family aminotransferase [Zetaproteobacteria bacterium]|nr:DegT/DnrJ/EryC1/StrS family aminotransferase [Zetaproteobacteria bacterium]
MAHDLLITALQNYLGVEHVVKAGRGSLIIYAALKAWGAGHARPGLVAVPAAVCQDVVAAILMAGYAPIFCDVDPATGLTPMQEWARARAAGASVAIVVHLYGNPADTESVRAIFPDGLIIDDAAQSLGADTGNGLAGTEGDVGVISFGHTKHIEIGGAALIARDPALANACAQILDRVQPASVFSVQSAEKTFRAGFEAAREQLRRSGTPLGFNGLLDGYMPTLRAAWNPAWSNPIARALQDYPRQLEKRHIKAEMWRRSIVGTPLIPIGMGSRSAPWRYTCRLPGIAWSEQYRLGQALRDKGLHVSHWYLPAHWLLGDSAGSLPGVERLAQEVFQFWLDDATALSVIDCAKPILEKTFNITGDVQ